MTKYIIKTIKTGDKNKVFVIAINRNHDIEVMFKYAVPDNIAYNTYVIEKCAPQLEHIALIERHLKKFYEEEGTFPSYIYVED